MIRFRLIGTLPPQYAIRFDEEDMEWFGFSEREVPDILKAYLAGGEEAAVAMMDVIRDIRPIAKDQRRNTDLRPIPLDYV